MLSKIFEMLINFKNKNELKRFSREINKSNSKLKTRIISQITNLTSKGNFYYRIIFIHKIACYFSLFDTSA